MHEILFVPDKHLGSYLQGVTGRPMILWDGSCMVHEVFSVLDLLRLKRRMPEALTLAHPECPANIREQSDFVGGTEAMLRYVAALAEPTDFLVATEANMLWQLQNAVPRHRYHPVPGHHLRVQQVPAHGPKHPGKAPRLPRERRPRDPLAARVRPGHRGPPAEPAELIGCGDHQVVPNAKERPPGHRRPFRLDAIVGLAIDQRPDSLRSISKSLSLMSASPSESDSGLS